MAQTSGTDDNAEFEMLVLGAGVVDVALECEPIRACDVMMPLDVSAPGGDESSQRTVVCGYWHALTRTVDEWREIIVVALAKTEQLVEIFDAGPGELIESSWDRVRFTDDDDDEGVLRLSIATWDRTSEQVRRFCALVPPMVHCDELTAADVFALCLVDLDDDDDDGDVEALSWFVENDSAAWVDVTPRDRGR